MERLEIELLGVNWTDVEVAAFITSCYDRDALLNVLLGYGARWLEGRLVCVVSKSSVQPFLARGWSSWGTDEETTEEFAQVSVPVKGSVTLRAVVEQGIPTVGEPIKLGLDELFEETSVLAPDKVAMIPLQIGGKTKMLLIGEPRVSTNDLDAFSEDISPLFMVAERVTHQLEEIIKLAKSRQLPAKEDRVPPPPATVMARIAREDERVEQLKAVSEPLDVDEVDDALPEPVGPATLVSEVDDVAALEAAEHAKSASSERQEQDDDALELGAQEISRTDLDGYFADAPSGRHTLQLKRRQTSQLEAVAGTPDESPPRKTLPIDIRDKQETSRNLQAVKPNATQESSPTTTQSGAPVSSAFEDDDVSRAEQELLKPVPLDVGGLPATPFDESSVADLDPDSWASAVTESAKQAAAKRSIRPKNTLKIDRAELRDQLKKQRARAVPAATTGGQDTPSAALREGNIPVSPRPLRTDPDVPQDTEEGGDDVAIIQPIGIGVDNPMKRRTLMGGFSMEDLKRAHDAQTGGARITMQGVSVVKERPQINEDSEGVAPEPTHDEAAEPAPAEVEVAPEPVADAPVDADSEGSADKGTAGEGTAEEGADDERPVARATLVAWKQDGDEDGDGVSIAELARALSEVSEVAADVDEPDSEPALEPDDEPEQDTDDDAQSDDPAPIKTLAGFSSPVRAAAVLEVAPQVDVALADDVPSIAPEYIEAVEVEPLTPSEVEANVPTPSASGAPSFPSRETVRLTSVAGAQKDLAIQQARSEARADEASAASEVAEDVVVDAPAPQEPAREVLSDEEIAGIITTLNGRDRAAAFDLASQITDAPELVPALMAIFPGRLYVDRYGWPVDKLAPVEEHGPVLAALANLGEASALAVAAKLDDTSLDVRFYATYLFTRLSPDAALMALHDRLDDRDRQTRAVAIRALARGKGAPGFDDLLDRMIGEVRDSNDTPQIEAAATLLGLVHDPRSIDTLINALERHGHRTGLVIHKALQRITLQALPQSNIAWRTWWSGASDEGRSAWVLRAMNSTSDEIRGLVAEEIARLRGVHINYHPDQPPSLRTRAQGQLKAWLDEHPGALA
jgi:hypothetical protein